MECFLSIRDEYVQLDGACPAPGISGQARNGRIEGLGSVSIGKIDDIRKYCETDVANTYLVFLRFQLFRECTTEARYRKELERVRDTLGKSKTTTGASLSAGGLNPRVRCRSPLSNPSTGSAAACPRRGKAGSSTMPSRASSSNTPLTAKSPRGKPHGSCGSRRESGGASPPRCVFFGTCGGCSMQHIEERAQVAASSALLEDALWHLGRFRPETMLRPLYGLSWDTGTGARMSVRWGRSKAGPWWEFRDASRATSPK